MTGDIIKEFLVGLGFEVDNASLTRFNKSIASAGLRISALYGAIKLTTSAVAYGISKISQSFEQLGYEYKILAPAINKALILRREMFRAYSIAGVNLVKVVQSSARFNLSLEKTKIAFEALYRSVASRFFERLTLQSELFRQRLYENMPKIQAALEKAINYLFKAFDAATVLGERLWSVLTRLHEATSGWSTIILAAAAAWKILNLSFLATPLGLILAGLLAILALYDDFMVWKEGGKSFFNWTAAVPVINAVGTALKFVWNILNGIAQTIADVILGFYQLSQGDWRGIKDTVSGIADRIRDGLFGGGEAQLRVPVGARLSGPALGSNTQNNSHSQSNQNVHQQTQITIQGVADANAAGKAVSSEQSRVNFDLIRNLKGATR